MKEIKAIIEPFMLDRVCDALAGVPGLPGAVISRVQGFGRTRDAEAPDRNGWSGHSLAERTKIEIVVRDEMEPAVVQAIAGAARTGKPGDGKIFVLEVTDVVRIRTGERGEAAI